MSKELVEALNALESERGIDRLVVVEALEDALKAAYKKQYNTADNVEATFDDKKGNISIKQVKHVVLDDDLEDEEIEISLSDALAINRAYEAGDEIRFDVTPKDFGRMAAQAAKQVIVQKMREAGRQAIYNKFSDYEDEIITGEVDRQDARFLYVNLPGNQEAVMAPNDQMPNERYHMGDRIKVLVNKVENNAKGHKSLYHEQQLIWLNDCLNKRCQKFMMVLLKSCLLRVRLVIAQKLPFIRMILT